MKQTSVVTLPEERSDDLPSRIVPFHEQHPHRHPRQEPLPSQRDPLPFLLLLLYPFSHRHRLRLFPSAFSLLFFPHFHLLNQSPASLSKSLSFSLTLSFENGKRTATPISLLATLFHLFLGAVCDTTAVRSTAQPKPPRKYLPLSSLDVPSMDVRGGHLTWLELGHPFGSSPLGAAPNWPSSSRRVSPASVPQERYFDGRRVAAGGGRGGEGRGSYSWSWLDHIPWAGSGDGG
ncbi:hypothetical protein B296_00025101 [Ensete ventricosum]|uniref:Uncharacterized protein n=1 Tax=Ensete ventricosum TaxID=4639 RepID=A0A427AHX5_ENSVE|nr:hypothetical protein B296_00025101 [Ensete ventricosum]